MNILTLRTKPAPRRARRGAGVLPRLAVARSTAELKAKMRSQHPDLVVLEEVALDKRGQDVIHAIQAASPSTPILLLQNVAQLAELHLAAGDKPPAAAPPAHTLPALHNPASSRLDARRLADFFQVSLSQVAHLMKRSPQSVHRTPDAPRLQSSLSLLARIAAQLTRYIGSVENARLWLNAPHPELDHARPLDLIRHGKGEVVAEIIEDALLGHPG